MRAHIMNIFDVLSLDERIVVMSDPSEGTIYTWNQSLTMQVWRDVGNGEWEEVDVRTLSDKPADFAAARTSALSWQMTGE